MNLTVHPLTLGYYMNCSLYIHIPYCNSRCFYCDFYSNTPPVDNLYIDTVISRIPNMEFETVYIGGGTPSLMSCEQLSRLCNNIRSKEEFTIEANPETLTKNFVLTALRCGVNRISLGIQSLNDKSLSAIGRRHSAQTAIDAIKLASNNGVDNISTDLMLGLPYQEKEDIDNFVNTMATLNISHISCYMLKLEPNVPLYNSLESLPNADKVADLYEYAVKRMRTQGYLRYEFSNFARDNLYSRHNMRYWDCLNYLGIGPSAHSCIDNKRFYYQNDTKKFIANNEKIPDGECSAEDYIMLTSRLSKGLSLTELYNRFGYKFSELSLKQLRFFEEKGLLRVSDDNITFTDRGLMIQNSILASIL